MAALQAAQRARLGRIGLDAVRGPQLDPRRPAPNDVRGINRVTYNITSKPPDANRMGVRAAVVRSGPRDSLTTVVAAPIRVAAIVRPALGFARHSRRDFGAGAGYAAVIGQ